MNEKDLKQEEEKDIVVDNTDNPTKEMSKAIETSIKEQEEAVKAIDELTEKYINDSEMKDIAKDLSDISKIDKKNINKLKDFKDYVDLSSGILNMNRIMTASLLDTHSKFMNDTMEKDDTLRTYFETIFVETDENDSSYYKIKVKDKYYTIKQEFLVELDDGKYTDYFGVEHKIIIRDMNKIQDKIFTILGDNEVTRDLLHGCDIIYRELNNLIFAHFSEDRMVKDVNTAYNYFFNENTMEKIVNDMKKEIDNEIKNKDDKKYQKNRTISRRNLTDGIITKINKVTHSLKNGQGDRFIRCITDFAFVIAYISELEEINKENVLDKLENINEQILADKFFSYERVGIETAMLKNIKSHILDKKGVTYIPALVDGMTYDVDNSPMIDYSIKLAKKLKEIR